MNITEPRFRPVRSALDRMQVKDLDSPDSESAMRAMVLTNDAEHGTGAGDPLELALLDWSTYVRVSGAPHRW